MYGALNIARYVINYAKDHNCNITNLKLQKILYYIQAAFLVKSQGTEGCFKESIVAWQHGPVVKVVYNEYMKYGAGEIPRQEYESKIVFENGNMKLEKIPFNDSFLSEDDEKEIKKVLSALLPIGAWQLVTYTHQEKPWKEIKELNTEIDNTKIYDYFSVERNRERIYGKFNQ